MPAGRNGRTHLCPYKESEEAKRDFSPSFGWVRNDRRSGTASCAPTRSRKKRREISHPASAGFEMTGGVAQQAVPVQGVGRSEERFLTQLGWVRNDGRSGTASSARTRSRKKRREISHPASAGFEMTGGVAQQAVPLQGVGRSEERFLTQF